MKLSFASFFVIIFLSSLYYAHAQSPYRGGNNDGYTSFKYENTTSTSSLKNPNKPDIKVYAPQNSDIHILTAQLPSNGKGEVWLSILNVIGNELYKEKFFTADQIRLEMDARKFPSGVYLVKISQGKQSYVERINILH